MHFHRKKAAFIVFAFALITTLSSCFLESDFLGLKANFGVEFPQDCVVEATIAQGYGREHYDLEIITRSDGFENLYQYKLMDTEAESEIERISQGLANLLIQVFHDNETAVTVTSFLPADISQFLYMKFESQTGHKSYAYLIFDPQSPQTAYFARYLH